MSMLTIRYYEKAMASVDDEDASKNFCAHNLGITYWKLFRDDISPTEENLFNAKKFLNYAIEYRSRCYAYPPHCLHHFLDQGREQ